VPAHERHRPFEGSLALVRQAFARAVDVELDEAVDRAGALLAIVREQRARDLGRECVIVPSGTSTAVVLTSRIQR
jgi:hypothetical protein